MSVINDIVKKLGILIPGLNVSSSSLIRKVAEACGSVMDTVLLEQLRTEQTIQSMLQSMRIASPSWFLDKAYAYQAGDNLVVTNPTTQELGYAVINPSKQIIKQAMLSTDKQGSFSLHIATANANRNLILLTSSQISAFNAYIQNFVPLGAQIIISTQTPGAWNANKLYIRYHNTYNLDDIKVSLHTVLHDIQLTRRYVNRVYINEVESTIMSIPGIKDAYFLNPYIFEGSSTLLPIDGTFKTTIGYFNFNPAFYNYGATSLTVFEAIE